MIRGHIHDALTSKGFGKAAELAKETALGVERKSKLFKDFSAPTLPFRGEPFLLAERYGVEVATGRRR
jgi:hypothetical protein